MLDKRSDTYKRIVHEMGLRCRPNIPRTISRLGVRARRQLRNALNGVGPQHTDIASRYICRTCPSRHGTQTVQQQYVYNDDDTEYRAFFIVSPMRLSNSRIHCLNNALVYMYGGRCVQAIDHYHYVIMFEYPTRRTFVRVPYGCNITGISTNTDAAKQYIRDQLCYDDMARVDVSGDSVLTWCIDGYDSSYWDHDSIGDTGTASMTRQAHGYTLLQCDKRDSDRYPCSGSWCDSRDPDRYNGEYRLIVAYDGDEHAKRRIFDDILHEGRYDRVRLVVFDRYSLL